MGGSLDLAKPPLSVAQEALWYQSLLHPTQTRYNETVSIRKHGPFDVAAFRRAFNGIVRRHEAWRTRFAVVGGEPVQTVQPAGSFDLPILDLGHLTPDQATRRAVSLMAGVTGVPYDVRRGPLLRPRLMKFPGDHYRLYLGLHHLVFDGVSVNRVVLPELVALYEAERAGRPAELDEPQAQYADYARWEQEWITQGRVARRLEYWVGHLGGVPVVPLPLDHPRPPAPSSQAGVIPLSIPSEIADRLREIARSLSATLFQVLATVWSLLLNRYSGQSEVVFATVADLRQRPEFEAVVGYCVTPVVLRVDLGDDPAITDLIVRVRNELLDGLDRLVPFERVVRELEAVGASDGNPVYQTMIVLEPRALVPDPSWSMQQLEYEMGDAGANAKVDVELQLDEHPDGGVCGRLIYARDLFEPPTARRMADHWLRLLRAVAAEPTMPASRIPILTPTEEHQQIVEWNATATERPGHHVQDLVHAQAIRQPEAVAVSALGDTISYGELDRRGDLIARRLLAMGVSPGEVVAVCARPGIDLVVGALGVLKARAAYLLVDPELPQAELEFRVSHAGAAAGLTQPTISSRLPVAPGRLLMLPDPDPDPADGAREEPAAAAADANDICCLHYGSPGGGSHNGVLIGHSAVVNSAMALAAGLTIGAADTVLALPRAMFELPIPDLWLPLCVGARVVLAPGAVGADGARISRLIKAEGVTFLHARPSIWQALANSGLRSARGLKALTGGEPLAPELADEILNRCRTLWNGYGVAETTGYCTLGCVERSRPVTIGRPLANCRAYVVGRHDRPAPLGVRGELLIGGDAVATGYHAEMQCSATAFIQDPFSQSRAYRTGQAAQWLPDGDLQLLPELPHG